MAENEATETATEVEMCNCGCGHTKEQTVQALMLLRQCDREEAEQAYVELGETITDEDRAFRDFMKMIRGDDAKQRAYEAESLRAKEAGEEMCPCNCGRSRKQIIEGFQEEGAMTEEQATALYEKCAAVERETPGGVTPEMMQSFLNEVVGN